MHILQLFAGASTCSRLSMHVQFCERNDCALRESALAMQCGKVMTTLCMRAHLA